MALLRRLFGRRRAVVWESTPAAIEAAIDTHGRIRWGALCVPPAPLAATRPEAVHAALALGGRLS